MSAYVGQWGSLLSREGTTSTYDKDKTQRTITI